MKSDIAELIEEQNTIIRMQSGIIDKLFLKLMEYTTAEELDNCKVVSEINEIANLKTHIDAS